VRAGAVEASLLRCAVWIGRCPEQCVEGTLLAGSGVAGEFYRVVADGRAEDRAPVPLQPAGDGRLQQVCVGRDNGRSGDKDRDCRLDHALAPLRRD
jgi:hypothetical protein